MVEVGGNMNQQRTETYRITGMDCADCAKTIERGVAKMPGVSACTLSFGAAVLKVEGDAPRPTVIARVTQLGYGVREGGAPTQTAPQTGWAGWVQRLPQHGLLGFLRFLLSRPNTTLATLGAILILPSLVFHELLPFLGVEGVWLTATALGALLVAGLPIARSAWRSLVLSREISINALMTIAAIGAVIIGAYTEAGLVMVLFAIGEALEGYTTERARESIKTLMTVAPNEATVLRACMDCQEHLGQNGYTGGACPLCGLEETRVFVDELRVGETIVVKPGERIAMDGRISKGSSAVNQAPITGESVPVEKQVGGEVFAGTINGEGALEMQVTRRAEDNTLSRIIKMVEEAHERKAPAERFVDRFARVYTPVVVVLAALVAVVPPLLFAQPFWGTQGWLYRALELLVVACPCALVISTPVAIISAISNAARNGVLIKGGAYLEALAKIKAIAFDKTGTLTEGKPAVIKVRAMNCVNPISNVSNVSEPCESCTDLLALANAVEKRSEHPLARAVVSAAETSHVSGKYVTAEDVKAITGKGVMGLVNGQQVLIGSHAYFDQTMPHDPVQCDEIAAASSNGQTPILVGVDGRYLGYISVADTVRESSKHAVATLHGLGVQATVMLTGDNAATARTIAQQVGVTEVKADLLPEHKLDAVKALLANYGSVAMVGDGVNDAPALATATVGIAMGAGTAQAMETADVVLMGNDLSKLPFAFALAQATMRTIRTNIVFAIGIKLAFLVLVLLGLGTMWLAVFADVGASLLVTLYSMRLARRARVIATTQVIQIQVVAAQLF
jgi:Cd2+/Zn2+-exporting ATPase